jgi:hypothetical protein
MKFPANSGSINKNYRANRKWSDWKCERRPRQQRAKSTLSCRRTATIDVTNNSQAKEQFPERSLYQ